MLAVAFVIALMFVITIFLSLVTQHSRIIEVPDLVGLSLGEAEAVASRTGIRVEIADSVYVRSMRPGAVFSQLPKAGAEVKKGRRVLLTTNALAPKMVSMPSLVGCSIRQAKAELSSRELVLGRFTYVEDIATNNVLRQMFRGADVPPGQMLNAGSKINLVLGLNGEDAVTYTPNVVGMRYLRAVDVVQDNSLNIGSLVFDREVKTYSDSLSAVVWKQSPEPSELPLRMGSEVVLYLKPEK